MTNNKRYHCPFCPAMGLHNEDYSLSVNWQKEVFLCFRCGTKGRTSSLPSNFRKPLILTKESEVEKRECIENMISLHDSQRAQDYLKMRGLDPNPLMNFVFVTNRRQLVFPIYEGGDIVYYITRKMWGKGPRYKNQKGGIKYLFVPYTIPETSYSKLVVTEGVFDALSVFQWTGLPSVALLGKNPNQFKIYQILKRTNRDSKIIILLDSDAIQSSMYYYNELQGAGRPNTSLCILREGDPNDLGEKKLWMTLRRLVSLEEERTLKSTH